VSDAPSTLDSEEPQPSSRRPKRERSATESLLSITLGMEILAVVFGTLAINGLGVLPSSTVFLGGGVLVLLLIVAMRAARYRWGVWFGSALQVLLLATGFIEVLAAVTAAVFVGFWVFGVVKGRQLDAAKAAYLATFESTDQEPA
jgi:hypothetical protein